MDELGPFSYTNGKMMGRWSWVSDEPVTSDCNEFRSLLYIYPGAEFGYFARVRMSDRGRT